MKPETQKPPVTAADIKSEWTDMIRGMLRDAGQPVRAASEPYIEVKSLTTNRWHPLGLPDGGILFTDAQQRDQVMGRIV